MKQIIIDVSPTGETKIETKGFTGPACKAASAFLETALGTKTADVPTTEMHGTTTARKEVTQ